MKHISKNNAIDPEISKLKQVKTRQNYNETVIFRLYFKVIRILHASDDDFEI